MTSTIMGVEDSQRKNGSSSVGTGQGKNTMSKCTCVSHFHNWERYFTHNRSNREIYNPMNLASIICTIFASHDDALIDSFVDDTTMFEYMYEFLPREIVIEVLNDICLTEAIHIVKNRSYPHNIYKDVDPALYVCRYYQNRKCEDPLTIDPHCVEFDTSIIPKNETLNFVLQTKKVLSEEDFSDLMRIVISR